GQRRGQLRQAGVRQGALDRAEHHRPPGPGPARLAEDRGRVLRHLRELWQGDPGPASRGTAVRHTLRGVCLPLQLIRRLALPLVIAAAVVVADQATKRMAERSEEHTSELQSREKLVCRLLLEKTTKTL